MMTLRSPAAEAPAGAGAAAFCVTGALARDAPPPKLPA
jgi:hypothetical protein